MSDSNDGPLPPYQATPNMPPPPPPTPAPPPQSSFGTVTPGSVPQGFDSQPGFGAAGPNGFEPPKKKSNTGVILAVIGVSLLVLVILAIVGLVLFARNVDLDEVGGLVSSSEGTIEDTVTVDLSSGNEISVDGEIGSGRFDVIEVNLSEGQSVVATGLSNSSVDPILTVLDPNNVQIARNDDALGVELPSSLDSQVRFTANSSGVYSIRLSDFANNDAGSYEVIIAEG